jgi:hypothetical protein
MGLCPKLLAALPFALFCLPKKVPKKGTLESFQAFRSVGIR